MVAQWEIRLLAAFGWFGRRPVRNLLLYLVGVVLVSAAVYALFEGAEIRYTDGLWWAIVTLTTVGYGDIAPDTVGMRAVAVWVMASGLVSVAAITGIVAARLSVAALRDADGTPGIDDDFSVLVADLADASGRVRHLQERFRFDERGDDQVSSEALRVIALHRTGALDDAAIRRLEDAVVRQRATDA
jgi:voltage-gated potassium channel